VLVILASVLAVSAALDGLPARRGAARQAFCRISLDIAYARRETVGFSLVRHREYRDLSMDSRLGGVVGVSGTWGILGYLPVLWDISLMEIVLVVGGWQDLDVLIRWLPMSFRQPSGRFLSALRTLHPALLDSGSGLTGCVGWPGYGTGQVGCGGTMRVKVLFRESWLLLSRGIVEARIGQGMVSSYGFVIRRRLVVV